MPIHYLQYDLRWGSTMFSNHGDPRQTLASSGCGATAFAMVLATFIDPDITPANVAQVVLDNGYRTYNNGVDWGFFPWAAEHYGLVFMETLSTDVTIEALKEGALVVASMGPGYFTRYGHYILLWGLDEDTNQILVNDPNSETRTKAKYNLFREEAYKYFIFYKPRRNEKVPEDWKLKIIEDAKQAELITTDHNPDEPATKWFALTVALNLLKVACKTITVVQTSKTTIHADGKTFPTLIVNGKIYGPIQDVCETLGHRMIKYEGSQILKVD